MSITRRSALVIGAASVAAATVTACNLSPAHALDADAELIALSGRLPALLEERAAAVEEELDLDDLLLEARHASPSDTQPGNCRRIEGACAQVRTRIEAIDREIEEISQRIAGMEAHTIAGLLAKARPAQWHVYYAETAGTSLEPGALDDLFASIDRIARMEAAAF
jgi:hypothetical protein